MHILITFLLRLLVVTAGLVVAAGLLAVAVLFAAVWGLRYAWARLTGRPVMPFVMRVDPRAGFGRVYRARARDGAAARGEPARPPRPEIGDVTDVQVKPPRS
ncbi:MAG: hypothetical protein JWQ13_1200 [Ramlibacter sp.]|jgi:hypothetical protein|nr:hypothetical protein [Ramlibacter sp.]